MSINLVNKFNWINDANSLIHLPDQLATTISCGDVKFRTQTTANKIFSLSELFLYVEHKASTDRSFAANEVITALRAIKEKRNDALANKAPKWSIKWIFGLLVQLGRAIARFLCCGCKPIDYNARLNHLSTLTKPNETKQKEAAPASTVNTEEVEDEEAESDDETTTPVAATPDQPLEPTLTIPTNSTTAAAVPVSRTTFVDGNKSELCVILGKLENNEPVTVDEFKTISINIVTLDLTTWNTPRQIAIFTTSGIHKFEWITHFINSSPYLKQVYLPDANLDPNLFHWLAVDPLNRNTAAPDYPLRLLKTASLSGTEVVFSRVNVALVFSTPLLSDLPNLTPAEAKHFYSFFTTHENFEQLLAVNFPHVSNKTVSHNLQALFKESNKIFDIIKNVQFLFDEHLVMFPTWATLIIHMAHEGQGRDIHNSLEDSLYKALKMVYSDSKTRRFLIPFIKGLHQAFLTYCSDMLSAKDDFISNKNRYLFALLDYKTHPITFTSEVANYLFEIGQSNFNVSRTFNTPEEFVTFIDYFLSSGITNADKLAKRQFLLDLDYTHRTPHLILLIEKLQQYEPEFCPRQALTKMTHVNSSNSGKIIYLQNIAFFAFFTCFKNTHTLTEQQTLFTSVLNRFDTLIYDDTRKRLKKLIIEQLAYACSSDQIHCLTLALLTKNETKTAENWELVPLLLESLINYQGVDGIVKLTTFFKTYWSQMPWSHGPTNIAVKACLPSLRTVEQLAAILKLADEMCLLEPQASVPQLPLGLFPLDNSWFEYLFAHQTKRSQGGIIVMPIPREEIATLLFGYPELCLRISQTDMALFDKIFPDQPSLKNTVLSQAELYVNTIYERITTFGPDPANLILEYQGFNAKVIAKARLTDTAKNMALRPIPRKN